MAGLTEDRNVITALFHSREDAEDAYTALIDRGFSEDEISVIMSKETRKEYYGDRSEATGERRREEEEMGNKAAEGAGVGAAVGGTAGGIAGALAAAAAPIAFPGIGVVLSGPLAAALAGAGAGGAAGTLVGALTGAGIPEERAKQYKSGLEEGGIVIAAHPRTESEADEIQDIFRRHNGERVYQYT